LPAYSFFKELKCYENIFPFRSWKNENFDFAPWLKGERFNLYTFVSLYLSEFLHSLHFNNLLN
jgi:hypothetical protein